MPPKASKPSVLAEVRERELGDFGTEAMRIYGTEVNEGRAIPSLQDGLKPVARRILWAASKIAKERATKTARVVGDCFAAGTQVALIGGKTVPIETLVVGDQVATDIGPRDVTNVFTRDSSTLYEVATDKGVVLATPDQVFYCLDASGSEVERTPLTLKPGDRIKTKTT